MPFPTRPRAGDREPAVWEPAQIASFLEHVSVVGDRLAVLYEVVAYTGLRRGELCGLRWSDLDADGGGLSVRQNLVGVSRRRILPAQRTCLICGVEHVGLVFKGPKTQSGYRWVPLARPAQAALRRHRRAQDVDRRHGLYRGHDLVFCAANGDPLRPGMISAQFVQRVKASGLPAIRLHDLRHGTCSLLLAGGVPSRPEDPRPRHRHHDPTGLRTRPARNHHRAGRAGHRRRMAVRAGGGSTRPP
jgi:integrase